MTAKLIALALSLAGIMSWSNSTTPPIRSVGQAEASKIYGACRVANTKKHNICAGTFDGGKCDHNGSHVYHDPANNGNQLGKAVCTDEPFCIYTVPNGASCSY